MVGDLVDAVVGHVGHGDAELGGGIDGDVIHADAVPADDYASLGGAHDVLSDLREAGQDAVDVPCHRHQRLLAGVGCDDEFGAPGCKHFTLGFYRGPHVVRDKDS